MYCRFPQALTKQFCIGSLKNCGGFCGFPKGPLRRASLRSREPLRGSSTCSPCSKKDKQLFVGTPKSCGGFCAYAQTFASIACSGERYSFFYYHLLLTQQKGQTQVCPFCWWEEVDSNHRSRRRQIYSLMHLATLQSAHIKFYPVETG